jgi:hypothetical protein
MTGTAHFSLDEFIASDLAARSRINNTLPPELTSNALAALSLLEKIRDYLSKLSGHDVPMSITSGYRCLELNTLLKSKASSDHVQGLAADFRAPSFGTPINVCRALGPQVGVLDIGQLINEFPGPNGWVHVSTKSVVDSVNRIITITSAGTRSGIFEA